MTNVVLVRHEADFGCGNYLFQTPVDLKKVPSAALYGKTGERRLCGEYREVGSDGQSD